MTKFKHNPLLTCTIRTAGLASANGAKFGMTRKNSDGTPRAHQGIDLACKPGYRVYAVEDAWVVGVAQAISGFGWTITLSCRVDNTPVYPFYAHLSDIRVKVGDNVKAGDCIGLTGDTGNARGMDTIGEGSHLHFGLKSRLSAGAGLGGWLDPLPYIDFV